MNTLIFVFSGLGAQWPGMGRSLLERDPVFCATVEELDRLFVAAGEVAPGALLRQAEPQLSDRSDLAHLLTFSYQVALTRSLASRGIVPAAVLGHSSGEVAAAHCAGILSAAAAVDLVVAHAVLIRAVAGQGEMLFAAVAHDRAGKLAAAQDGVEIAAFNSHASVVFCGPAAALGALSAELARQQIFARRLRTTIAFHSRILEPHLERFACALAALPSAHAGCAYYSSLTGGRFSGPWDADYWRRHIRNPVRFSQAVQELLATHAAVELLEMSPHPILGLGLRADIDHHQSPARVLPLMEQGCDEPGRLAALPALLATGAAANGEGASGAPAPQTVLRDELTAMLGAPPALGAETTWFDLGISSLQIVQLGERLQARLGRPVSPALFFRQPRVEDFLRALQCPGPRPSAPRALPGPASDPVAIIGMAFRFPPDLDSPAQLADFLRSGASAIAPAPVDREGLAGERAGFLAASPWAFDARYFGITAAEAQALDPQQRLLLEVSCHALEDAMLPSTALRGENVGVFLGISTDDFKELLQRSGEQTPYTATGSMFNTASGRLSYFHDFRGPAVSVDTACSSSLVALHQAARALRSGECDLALAGGVNLILSRRLFEAMRTLGALSPSGSCKPFAASADGYARSEGCALLVLKRLDAALADGDPILATIRGSAVNQDGRSNGLTAPNGAAQSALIAMALADAGLGVNDLSLIETHGTGTPLGDPIEVAALAEALADRDPSLPPILLGALKSQLGHLEACAGVAGVIKTILAFQLREVPGIRALEPRSRHIDWQKLPLRAADASSPLPHDRPLLAGVSAFGFSGTNAHLLLEAPPPRPELPAPPGDPDPEMPFLFAISAKSDEALRRLAGRYLQRFEDGTLRADLHLGWSQLVTRDHHPCRFAMVVTDRVQLLSRLAQLASAGGGRRAPASPGKIAMLLPGQGSQYAGMGHALYRSYPVFRTAVDECAALCAAQGFPVLSTLYPESPDESARIDASPYAQLAYLAFAWGAFALWRSFGISPGLLIGHSMGEYVAAALAGALTLEDAIRLIIRREALVDDLPVPGRMATVMAAPAAVAGLLAEFPGIEIAVINGPAHLVVAGEEPELTAFCSALEERGIDCRPLAIRFASHSRLVEPALAPFAAFCASIDRRPPRIPVISNLTGEPFAAGATFSAAYWQEHLRQPVDFARCLATATRLGVTDYVELGPSSILTSIIRAGATPPGPGLMQTASRTRPAWPTLFASLQELYLRGFRLDWPEIFAPFAPRKVALPLYPFEHQPFLPPNGAYAMNQPEQLPHGSETTPAPAAPAVAGTLSLLKEIVQRVTWKEPDDLDPAVNLFSLGIDSLMLVQIRQQIDKAFGVNIALGEFYETLDTLEKLAVHLETLRPPAVPAPPPLTAPPPLSPLPPAAPGMTELFTRQLEALRELCNRQLDLLGAPSPAALPPVVAEPAAVSPRPRFNFRSMRLTPDPLSAEQERFIADFAARFNRRTAGSKAQAARYRRVLADWINSLGYKQSLKELVYPIVAERSQGAHFVDIDGNDYIDLAMGYGVTFLGHRPEPVMAALREQLEKGFELGPQSRLAGEVAALVSELTGVERVAFCNTGSEAVMVAIRVARAVSGRDKIVIFANSYHGTFDAVLATALDGETYPTAAGIPRKMVEDVQILTYGGEEALELIRAQGGSLAAVLVEPVQSRNPALRPVAFLRQLREITREHDVALIFDETITGFRMHPGGAQQLFGVRADLVVYGKAVGGGMPLSLVAGSARYLDAIDGGDWAFGDDSRPSDNVTFFAGTYVKHPLALAAAKASLTMLKEAGPALQQRTGALLDELAARINAFFVAEEVPVRLAHFGSMFRFEGQGKFSLALDPIEMDLFFHLLMEQGIYTWERRICFLSAAHSADDIERIVAAVQTSIARLREGDFPFRTPCTAVPAAASRPPSTALTSAQLRLLVFDHLAGEKTLYNLPLAFLLAGEIDAPRLESALLSLLERHPALTARFTLEQERPGQAYVRDPAFRLERLEAEGREIEALIHDLVRPFALADELLVRAVLCRLSAGRHLLFFDFHHLVADGLALSIFIQELMAICAGEALPPAAPHYAEFVAAEVAYRHSAAAAADRSFWLAQFAAPFPPLALPTDFPRPAEQDHQGDNVFFRIPTARTASLKQAAGHAGISLFSLLLAAYGSLLQRLSGESRLVVGIPVDARPAGFEQAVGMFASTLALPLKIDPELPFRDLARQVQKDFLNAYEHQRYPFDDLVRDLHLPRDLGRNPLFDTMFIYENGQNRRFHLPDLLCTPCPYNKPTAMFDLTFEVIEADGELHCRLEYATALFCRESMERLAGRLERVLTAVAADPACPPAAIELLSAEESAALAQLNRTAHPFAADATIPQRWALQLEKEPDAVALVSAGTDFTRRWLDEQANRIARAIHLRIAPQPDDRVAILIERSVFAPAALLGILKAGAAYVPISPDFPDERRSAIMAASGARALVTSRLQGGAWSDNCGVPVIVVEELDAAESSALPEPGLTAEHLAYIMFTSGSTGAPKGVMISHRNVVAMAENLPLVYGITAADTLLAVTTFTFDISVLEIFCCLLVGTRIVLASDDDNLAIAPLAGLFARHGVTAFQTTPSRLKLMLELSGEEAVLGPLQTVLIGGEAFPADLFARLRGARPRIFNVYGPTETTIWSTSTLINGKEVPTIGRPLLNEEVHILDRNMRPVPPGGSGELYIGGQGVGRGYLGMSDLTARKFVPAPWGEGRERLYATGDLVRLRQDGELEFLGRGDDQIKLRGYRIELQEIENRLVTHPALVQAAVKTVLDPESGEVRDLAAYYTLRRGVAAPAVEALREHLGQWLPPYMLPAFYCPLDRMPLNPSGKIDRKALPEARPAPVADLLPVAGGAQEQQLAAIFAQVLGVETVNAGDNFFALGGDSIRAIQVAARARKAGFPLDVRQLFAHPTLRELAAILTLSPPPEQPCRPREEPDAVLRLGLAPMQEGMLFHSLLDAAAEAYVNQAEFTVHGGLDGERFAAAWQSLSDRHAMLRTRFATRNTPNPCQLVLPRHPADLRREDLARLSPVRQAKALEGLRRSERARLTRVDAAPPIAIVLVRLGESEWRILWSFHHSLLDGWSIAILLREFLQLYRGATLPEPQGDFPDYLRWLAGRNQSEALHFWQERLAGARPALLCPPSPPEQGYRPAETHATLAAPLLQGLEQLARTQALTVNALLQAAWAAVLQEATARDDLLFGATVSGRPAELAGVEEMVGLFINTLPVRVTIPAVPTALTDLAREIQGQNLAAIPHQYLSLATIQAALGCELFDHLLIFENYPLESGVEAMLTADGNASPVTAVSFFEHTHYPLEVIIIPAAELRLTFRYNRRVVETSRVEALATRFASLLATLADDPALTVTALAATSSRKADADGAGVAALRQPALPAAESAPADAGTLRLCTLFARILELPEIRADDHFFTCGGHSLKVVRLAGLIWEELGVEVPLRTIYTHPTPRSLALALSASSGASPLEVVAGPVAASYPLSEGQKGLWLLQQLQPASCAYNTVGSYRLDGALDPLALEQALSACAMRHEALRTSFQLEAGEPRQRIHDLQPPLLQHIDLRGAGDPEAEVRQAILQQLATPFALEETPLFRVTLFTLGSGRHVLSLIFHHIISDGWSDGILARDLSRLYRLARTATPDDLPPLALHYRDFAQAQLRYLAGEQSRKARSFWAEALAGALPEYDILPDRPRPARRSGLGARFAFDLGEAAAGLRQLARQERVTPFVVLQTLLKLLIHAVTAADDLIVGVPSANRSHPATQGLVGYFLNPLPIRTQLREDEPLTRFLDRVQCATLAAFEHQDYPFSAMVDDLKLPLRPNRHPLFDVMLIFHNDQPPGFELPGVECTPFFAESVTSRFDLDFEFFDDARLSAFIEFDSELYNPETIEWLARTFVALAAAAQPQASIRALAELVSRGMNAADAAFISQANSIGDDF